MDCISRCVSKLQRNHPLLRKLLSILSIIVPYKNVSYLEQGYLLTKKLSTTKSLPLEFKLLYSLFTYQMIKLSICNFTTTTDVEKILWFDYFRLIGLPENFNLSLVLIYAQFLYFYHLCYFRTYREKTIQMAYQVLVLKQVKTIFLEDTIHKRRYAIVPLVRKVFLSVVNYQQVNIISCVAFAINSQLYLFSFMNQNSTFFPPLAVLLVELNALLTYASHFAFVHIANLAVSMAVTTVLIHFILLQQIKSILYRKDVLGSVSTYRLFIHHQIKCLLNVFTFDRALGWLLFAYIVTNCPMNALAFSALIRGGHQKDPEIKGNLVQFIIGQFIPFFLVHLMAAEYSNRLHKPTLRLMALSRRTRYRSLRDQLYVGLFIERMHTAERYGITYAGMGLVTMYSFVRFCVQYHQLLMFVLMFQL